MELDPIEQFLSVGNKRFSLFMLINAHSRLSILQMNKGSVSFEDIMQCLSLTAGPDLSSVELNAHAALIYEGALVPVLTAKGPLLRINKDMLANDANFLKGVITVMYAHGGGAEHPSIEEFKVEATSFLKKSISTTNPAPVEPAVALNPEAEPQGRVASSGSFSLPNDTGLSVSKPLAPAPEFKPANFSPASLSVQGQQSQQGFPGSAFPAPPPGINPQLAALRRGPPAPEPEPVLSEIEKTEPIVRLLAHIRKEGMDILFPQIIQDKVLMSIYAAIKCGAPLAHRELIDMVMAVKEGSAITQLEQVSRTKVRGVLALLKHAQLFVTHGAEGEAVRLHLASNVTSFKDLRDRHDTFVNRYILQHHLFIPVNIKGEVVWQLDPEIKARRLEELKSLEAALVEFFKAVFPQGPRKAPPPPQVPAPNTPLEYGNISVPSSSNSSAYGDNLPYDYGLPQERFGSRQQPPMQQQYGQQSQYHQQLPQQQHQMKISMLGGNKMGGGYGNQMPQIPRSTNPLAGMNGGYDRGGMGGGMGGGGGYGGGYHQNLSRQMPPQMREFQPKNQMGFQRGGPSGYMHSEADYQGGYSPNSMGWKPEQSHSPFPPRPMTGSNSHFDRQSMNFDALTSSNSNYSNYLGEDNYLPEFNKGVGGLSSVASAADSPLYSGSDFGAQASMMNPKKKESPLMAPLSQNIGQLSLADNSFPPLPGGGNPSNANFLAPSHSVGGVNQNLDNRQDIYSKEVPPAASTDPTTPWSQLFYASGAVSNIPLGNGNNGNAASSTQQQLDALIDDGADQLGGDSNEKVGGGEFEKPNELGDQSNSETFSSTKFDQEESTSSYYNPF